MRRGDIILISKPCNIAQGRNLGIAAATGSHIAVTDAGCELDPSWLKEIVSCFRRDPRVESLPATSDSTPILPSRKRWCAAHSSPIGTRPTSARYYPSSRSVSFTKAAWEKAGGYPEWLYAAEDTLFNIRLRQVGCEFTFCRDAIVRWRPRENWRALANQRINFSRGNARIGVSTTGYVTNLRVHGLIAALILASPWYPYFLLAALGRIRLAYLQASLAAGGRRDPRQRVRNAASCRCRNGVCSDRQPVRLPARELGSLVRSNLYRKPEAIHGCGVGR